MFKTLLLRGICVALAGATSIGAAASTNNSTDTGASDNEQTEGSELSQVLVTARRREESLQEVPIAITVLSQQELQDNNVTTLSDVQYLVPSLSVAGAGYKDGLNFNLRGQGLSTGGPGVVVYMNEIPVPTVHGEVAGGPGLMFDLENIQVLKGPQGTLFGQNSMGGNVLLQTARPTQEFGGDIQATYGNYNDREINANINIPLVSDVLLTRFAFTGQWRDGYTHILAEPAHPDGVDSDNRDTWSVRGTVVFRPNDSIQNDTIATYSRYDSVASPAILAALFPNAPDGVPALYAQQQALGVRTSLPIDVNDISDGSNLAIDNITRIEIADGLTFRNIFGDAYTYQWLELDQGGIPLPIFDFPLGGGQPPQPNFWGHARQLSEEAQLQGKALADSLDWVAGAFYLDTVPPDFVLQTANVFGVDSSQQLYKDGGISRAIFAQGTYQVIPRVKITGGIRYTKDVRTNVQRGAVSDSVCYGAVLADCGPATELRFVSRAHAITWTGALDYQVTQDTLTYFTSRRGYRAGGFNIGNVLTGNSNPPGFGPEFVTDYELGLKSDWKLAGMPIRTNADLWYQDYTDIQVTTLDPVYGNLTRNAAAARFWGAELEAQANLTQDLQLGVNFNYLNRRYTHFDSTAVGTADLIASETLYNPPYKYGVDLRYHLPLGSEVGDVSARANWSWQSTGGDTLVPLETIKAYGLLNMSADWKGVFGSSLDVSLFATNVLNKLYVFSPGLSFQPGAFGFGTDVYGEPRMYGVRLRYRFGAEAR